MFIYFLYHIRSGCICLW